MRQSTLNRIRPVAVKALQKTRLNKVAHKVYYRWIHGFKPGQPDVLRAVRRSLRVVHKLEIPGDYCEFGIFKGYTFWYAQKTARELGVRGMRFFGFDSFAGLPEVEGPDQTDYSEFYKGQYACSKQAVTRNLRKAGVDWRKTTLVDGYFSATLNPSTRRRFDMRRVAVALIDCDLYTSTRDVLKFLGPLLMDGSILIMDDWNCFRRDKSRGQRKALREFLRQNPHVKVRPAFSYGTYGKVFVILILSERPRKFHFKQTSLTLK